MKLNAVFSFIKNDLKEIESELERTIQSEYPLLSEAGLHLLQAGGKRIRPVFVMLSSMFGDYDIKRVKRVAVSLELIHMASLVHDDVIDDAKLRRGKPTIKEKWDNRIAMYTGDFLFARSLEMITFLDNPLAHKLLSKTIVEVCLGEIEQIKDKFNVDQNLRQYLQRIKRKTALLIATSCQLGAISTEVDDVTHQRLFWFGYYIGMSYQIIDDILDFTSSEKKLGKPVGSDLLQGNITLPVLYSLHDPKLSGRIKKINKDTPANEMTNIIKEIRKSPAIDQSFELSNRYLHKALNILDKLPDGEHKIKLEEIANYIGKRKF
ncbi:heptaprenyl diphosphate synthase component II [Bacillus carboniphilus]|uniref:Heptaprenyl diphosphate synthase component II n=1 Tax=Bacillus carboniphilus TaxID=86663 RepID=A0ABY9K1E9_9BACI|nr:heptaprenyl diphosphate synthase component II [Bacillus carboniphilus]WLR43741.1 heptaprenyl diphosphate synthase component II [Bacillus carboniphilus]